MEKKILPDGWKMITLKQAANYVNGRAFKPAEWENSGMPIIRIQNLNNPGAKYNFSTKKHDEKFLVKSGDLLFAWAASLGAFIWTGKNAWLNQHIFRVEPNAIIDKLYLYYALKNVISDIYAKTHGSGMVHITKEPFLSMQIPLPSLPEQYRIVAKIEGLFSELDKGVVALQKVKAQLKVYRQAVLNEAFGHLLNNTIPLCECVKKIFDGPFGSNLKTADYVNKGVRVVRLENIKNQWFDNSKQSFITKEKYDTIQTHTAFPDDVIMATFLADETKVCLLPSEIPFAVNKADCIVIRPNEINIPKFLMYFLSSRIAYQQLNMQIHGATRPRVNTKQIKKIQIPALSTNEQNKIIQEIESRLSVCDKIQQTVDESLKKAEQLRQSILKQAFEGKLV